MSVMRNGSKWLRNGIFGAGAAVAAATVLASCAAAGAGAGSPAPGRTSSLIINGDLFGVAALSAGDVWAVGSTDASDPVTVHWNGSAWTEKVLPLGKGQPGDPPGGFNAVAAVSPHDVWAVGVTAGEPLAEHWNGRAWARVPSPHLAGGGTLNAVTSLSPTDAWTAGTGFLGARPSPATIIEHWDGRAWTLVPSPAAGDLAGVTALSPGSAWAAGSSSVGGGSTAAIEHWDGRAWTWPADFCASPTGPGCPQLGSQSPAPS